MTKFIRTLLLFSPLIFFAYTPWTLFPAIFGRTIIFQIIVEIILLILVSKSLFKNKKNTKSLVGANNESGMDLIARAKEILYSPIGIGLVLFTFVQILSFFFSIDREESFWGSMSRMDGIFTWLHLMVFFFLLSVSFTEDKHWDKFILINVLVAGVLSVLAIIQRYHDLFPEYIIQSGRVYATFGNPVFFAPYLLFTIFSTLYLVLKIKELNFSSRKSEFAVAALLLSALVLQVLALFWTRSQGSIGGFFAGILLVIFLLINKFLKRKTIKILFFILLLFFALGIVYKLGIVRAVTSKSINLIEGLEPRLIAWKIGLQGFLDRPILGFGPSTYEYVFDKYYDPALLKYSFYETVSDKPHNIFIEILDHLGTLGVASYFALILLVIRALLRLKKIDWKLYIFFSGALFAYLLSLQFVFDTTNSLFMLMVFLALITYKSKINLKIKNITNTKAQNQDIISSVEFRVKNFSKLFIKILSIIVLLGAFWFGNVQAWAASVPVAKSENKYWLEKPVKWGNAISLALSRRSPHHDEIGVVLGQDLVQWDALGTLPYLEVSGPIELLTRKLSESSVSHPMNFQYKFTYGQVLSVWSENFDYTKFEQAIATMSRAVELSPKRQAAHLVLGKFYMIKGDAAKAEEVITRAINIYDRAAPPYWFLGLSKAAQGKLNDAVLEFKRAKELGYGFNINEIKYWMMLNDKLGKREDNIELNEIFQAKIKDLELIRERLQ